ncbi:MAG: endonuclease III [Candidatus Diapherotrites archaeon]|nr:endonuclease III [Candidatus Diapherotrites archaeon]
MRTKERALKILSLLEKNYPRVPKLFLSHETDAQMLCAIILSARNTDKQTNKVTSKLFKKYKIVSDFAGANAAVFMNEISSIGLYKSKSKNIISSFKKIRDDFDGKIPQKMEELLQLPGVGRKTANLVLVSLGKIEGIAVDTHVARLSCRFGLSKSRNPDVIERDLVKIYPRNKWSKINGLFISHGRAVCTARNPKCGECFLNRAGLCPRIGLADPI